MGFSVKTIDMTAVYMLLIPGPVELTMPIPERYGGNSEEMT